MMKKACIVGFGAIGPVHARAVAKSEYGCVHAICDCNRERADKGAKRYHAKAVYDFQQVLQDDEIDVVHICTPHYLHKEMAVAALSAGKNIVLEKPLSIMQSELDEILAAYRASGKKACIMLQNRTNYAIAAMKRLIESDDTLGKMRGICGFMTWNRGQDYYSADPWRGKWATEGGGLLINQAIHMIDLIDWLGGGIQAVKSHISAKILGGEVEVEDTADALFLMNNGCRGVFYATNTYTADMPFRIEVNFEHATLRYADGRLYKITGTVEVLAEDAEGCDGKQCWGGSHQSVVEGFYAALEGRGGAYIDLLEGFHSAKVMLSMYRGGMSERKDWIEI